jgi:hypothetical protein
LTFYAGLAWGAVGIDCIRDLATHGDELDKTRVLMSFVFAPLLVLWFIIVVVFAAMFNPVKYAWSIAIVYFSHLTRRKQRPHEHLFNKQDVLNLDIDPKCVHCGIPLSEANHEELWQPKES